MWKTENTMSNLATPELIPVILSGGTGSRLWPLSRKHHPKPFIRLPDGETLMEKTYTRALQLPGVQRLVTVTNRDLYFRTCEEYQHVSKNQPAATQHTYLLEPFGRNTAAATLLSALMLSKTSAPEALLLVMPADQLLLDQQAFQQALQTAQHLATQNLLVTFGIEPDHPETGYGYIQANTNNPLIPATPQTPAGLSVKQFIEKPPASQAQQYLQQGGYYWNAGIFCFQIKTLLQEASRHAPELLQAAERTLAASEQLTGKQQTQLHLDEDSFASLPSISLDYALMEKSDRIAVVPCNPRWSDIGSWPAIASLQPADTNGNRLQGDCLLLSTSNTYIHSPKQLTAVLGVQDLIIVNTEDALLVAHKDAAQDVKKLVDQLQKTGHDAHLTHRTVHRPWGSYTTLEEGERFKIKKITVKPGASLSLQLHHHRSEHWVVVKGAALVQHEQDSFLLNTNESTFIPAGHKHRLSNPGVVNLTLIEVQSGDYLGEDDLVRYEDNYGRN